MSSSFVHYGVDPYIVDASHFETDLISLLLSPFDLLHALSLPIVIVGLLWLALPYWEWWSATCKPLECHVAKTSFQVALGELIPPSWKPPQVALSVVIPAYNEEHRLPQMLEETFSYLEARAASNPGRFSYEVVVVDDGSTDSTYAAALSSLQRPNKITGETGGVRQPMGGELRVVRLCANSGKGFAVKIGMLVARGELLLLADADGATSIRDVERLERSLLGFPKDVDPGPQIAFGSRHHLKQEARAKRSSHRNLLRSAFHAVVWLFVGGSLRDTQCGFKLFRAKVGKQIFASLHLSRWAFDIEVVLLARIFNREVVEVPITWVEMPGSKLNLLTGSVAMFRDIVLLQALYNMGIWRAAH